MRTRLRTRAAVVVAILAGVVLALSVTSGPAVAFFSGGLFLDVQVNSPATLVARGAAVDVPLEVTCNAPGGAFVFVTVTQRSGSGVASGSTSTSAHPAVSTGLGPGPPRTPRLAAPPDPLNTVSFTR